MVEQAKVDIQQYLAREDGELLFNERDLQMHLAQHLMGTGHYDDVDVEYYVPYEELDNYIWKNELKLDILLCKGSEFLPVELKYKTKKHPKQLSRFGERLKRQVDVLKNQGAQDLGMYDFWKDVRRVELVRRRFRAVKNGLVVFVTNDNQYLNKGKTFSNNYRFSMEEGSHDMVRHWQQPNSTCAKTHPDFELDNNYVISWNKNVYEGVEFYYCIVEI
ncbi:MAG: hypothetical protein II887_02840 [Bacteroidales bacterium]|nr:hypothetical protein [Bacteroidales bacterium]